jgi:hypothetical protein
MGLKGIVTMRDDDFWNRNFHHYPTRKRDFWDDHAQAMEDMAKGHQNMAENFADSIVRLWRCIRQWYVKAMEESEKNRHLPPL